MDCMGGFLYAIFAELPGPLPEDHLADFVEGEFSAISRTTPTPLPKKAKFSM